MFPATAQASKDTPKGRAPSYDESIQGRPRKRVKRGKREGKKERGRERERRERKVFPATNNRPGTHQRKKGEILSITFRKTPESKERKGEGRGRRGAKFSTGSNEPQKSFGRSDHVEALSQLGPLRSRKGMSQLGTPKMGQKSSYVRPRPPAARFGHLHLQSKEDNDKPPFHGSTGGTLRAHPGLARGQTHLWICVLN